MTSDYDAILDDLIRQWHIWSLHDMQGLGFPSVSPGCCYYRTSRQYDDVNGALDTDAHQERMSVVDHAILSMADPWRTAVSINARNLATGAKVWRSVRLPQDDMQRAVLVAEARDMLARRLMADGLI